MSGEVLGLVGLLDWALEGAAGRIVLVVVLWLDTAPGPPASRACQRDDKLARSSG